MKRVLQYPLSGENSFFSFLFQLTNSKMAEKIIKALYPLVAIVSLTILEIFAIRNGVDGRLFLPVVAIVAGIAGYELGVPEVILKSSDKKDSEEEL